MNTNYIITRVIIDINTNYIKVNINTIYIYISIVITKVQVSLFRSYFALDMMVQLVGLTATVISSAGTCKAFMLTDINKAVQTLSSFPNLKNPGAFYVHCPFLKDPH